MTWQNGKNSAILPQDRSLTLPENRPGRKIPWFPVIGPAARFEQGGGERRSPPCQPRFKGGMFHIRNYHIAIVAKK